MGEAKRTGRQASPSGLVFSIQKFSLHDGCGIRTLVFLKGCPLSCTWCANPEGQSFLPELAYNPDKCIGTAECGRCMDLCEQKAIREGENGKVAIQRMTCTNCGLCADACPSKSMELFGKRMEVEDLMRVVEEDSSFYARSGGGLTLSGGEPLSQAAFVAEVLGTAQGRGIDTAVETSGLCNWEDLERACVHVNQVFYDVKVLDTKKHREGTGVGNEPILDNLRRLCDRFPRTPIVVRTPVIPGFNDSPAEIRAISDFLRKLPGSVTHELLAYHGFGEPKYRLLGMEYPLRDLAPPSGERMGALRKLV